MTNEEQFAWEWEANELGACEFGEEDH